MSVKQKKPPNSNTLLAYHKFVKTTPNPNATKNRRGELVGPPLLVDVAVGVADVTVALCSEESWELAERILEVLVGVFDPPSRATR